MLQSPLAFSIIAGLNGDEEGTVSQPCKPYFLRISMWDAGSDKSAA